MIQLVGNYFIPSFDRLLDSNKCFYLQNLPSIICGKVLEPKPGEQILDMCSCPGGKTLHIAAQIKNQGRIIACDKIASKVERMRELCESMNGHHSIECVTQDVTKIDFESETTKFKPGSFDRILVDAPCSALGQRPLLFNDIEPKQLSSYAKYQRNILDNAYRLLRSPNGVMVYSTCTITIEENEEQVSWLLSKYKDLRLVDQAPFVDTKQRRAGLKCSGLSDDQLKLLQRFGPYNNSNNSQSGSVQSDDVYEDTNGFFIAKFIKL
jgi:16S rRNA C967 or C1407 C5-methylase (RsmB/RsmF family)